MYVSLALQFAYICAHEIYDFKRFCFLLEESVEVVKNTAFCDDLKKFLIELGAHSTSYTTSILPDISQLRKFALLNKIAPRMSLWESIKFSLRQKLSKNSEISCNKSCDKHNLWKKSKLSKKITQKTKNLIFNRQKVFRSVAFPLSFN